MSHHRPSARPSARSSQPRRTVRRAPGALAALAGLLASLVAGCEGRPSTPPDEAHAKRSGPALGVIDLTAGLPEVESGGLLGLAPKGRTLADLVEAAPDLDGTKDVKGWVVAFGSANFGAARAEELATVLSNLKKSKPVVCHGDGFGNTTMMVAARGCTKIVVSPAGGVDTVGLAAQTVYLRKLLADELKLTIDMMQVGKFKGAEEPLTRDGPSPEARASLEAVLADLRARWLEGIGARSAQAVDAAEDGPHSPAKAKERGLVDEVGYLDDAKKMARELASAERELVVFGPGAEPKGELAGLVRALAGDEPGRAPVVVLRATGSIGMSRGGGGLFGGRAGIVEKDFDRTVDRLAKDDEVKAVVLRIDSPGGSALASDLMWHHLMKLRAKKPLVVSVGDMAASGGYYLSCAGTTIFAEPMSIVGSIGVVGGKVGVGEALERIGVHAETFPAARDKPGAAARAGYESPLVGWDEPTKARVLESMTAVYDLFLSRIAEGRQMPVAKVAESAEGRIFAATDAKRRGLVDELGGLEAALAKARELAKLAPDARFAVVGGHSSLLDALEGAGGAEEAAARAEERVGEGVAEAFLGRAFPEVREAASALRPLVDGERTLTALPFALRVR